MLPKFHDVLASCVSTISTHCTAIVLLVLVNGPVKMLVAAALDEMMAGTLFADVNEPLYMNVLAPDNEIADAADDGVIDPVTDIVAADEQPNPIAPDPPSTDPDILIVVAAVDIPDAAPPPVTDPVIVSVCPLNNMAINPLFPEANTPPPVMFPLIVKFPTD